MTDVSEYQKHINGPLKDEVIEYLQEKRSANKWSYATLGGILGISGPFAHNILNKKGNITTSTAMQKIGVGIIGLKTGSAKPVSISAASASKEMLEHSYNLRSDLALTISLPVDLTEKEAERLSLFIRSLAQ